jgi:acyl-CoA reductase-like NAD-dependent aldehyde dehydrogenase
VPHCGPDDVRRAIDAASDAFPSWSTSTAYQRSEYLYSYREETFGPVAPVMV